MASHPALDHLRAIHARGPVVAECAHSAAGLTGWNRRLAVAVTDRVGSMWCAYAFAGLALISLPAALASRNVIVIVAWLAQTLLQLVLLPVIMVGQRVQTAAADARAETDHEILGHTAEVLADLHEHISRMAQVQSALAPTSVADAMRRQRTSPLGETPGS